MSNGLKVALVVLHADPARGGSEQYTAQLAGALNDEAVVLSSGFAETWPTHPRVTLDAAGPTRTGAYNAFCRSLDQHLQTVRYDVVHAMLPVPPGVCDVYHPHAGIAAARTGSRLGWWTNPRRRRYARVERDLLSSPAAPLVLTLSGLVEDELRRAHPCFDPSLTRRLFNGVDLDRYRPDAPPLPRSELAAGEEDVLAVFASNNFELKGLHPLIEALARVKDDRLKLAVVGRDDPGPFKRLAKRLGILARVHFAGPRRDLDRLYATADLLVLPTRRDSCSLVVLEALAAGLPVVSTKSNGACEIMADGREGRVLERWDDVDALAGALRSMLDDPARQQMHQAALALRPELSWQRHLERLRAVYAEAAERRIRASAF